MRKVDVLKKEIEDFLQNELHLKDYFCIIYGSYASGVYTDKSDLDLMVFTDEFLEEDLANLTRFVINFHKKNNLTIDEEVPFNNKLIITFKCLEEAINLVPFTNNSGNLIIPQINKTKEELSSENIKMRLCLNAISTLNLFVCGDENKYHQYKKAALKAVIRLLSEVNNLETIDLEEITNFFFSDKTGQLVGEDYLGYKDKGNIREYIRSQIKDLI
jgi:predicted nucleotidyltransferase